MTASLQNGAACRVPNKESPQMGLLWWVFTVNRRHVFSNELVSKMSGASRCHWGRRT